MLKEQDYNRIAGSSAGYTEQVINVLNLVLGNPEDLSPPEGKIRAEHPDGRLHLSESGSAVNYLASRLKLEPYANTFIHQLVEELQINSMHELWEWFEDDHHYYKDIVKVQKKLLSKYGMVQMPESGPELEEHWEPDEALVNTDYGIFSERLVSIGLNWLGEDLLIVGREHLPLSFAVFSTFTDWGEIYYPEPDDLDIFIVAPPSTYYPQDMLAEIEHKSREISKDKLDPLLYTDGDMYRDILKEFDVVDSICSESMHGTNDPNYIEYSSSDGDWNGRNSDWHGMFALNKNLKGSPVVVTENFQEWVDAGKDPTQFPNGVRKSIELLFSTLQQHYDGNHRVSIPLVYDIHLGQYFFGGLLMLIEDRDYELPDTPYWLSYGTRKETESLELSHPENESGY